VRLPLQERGRIWETLHTWGGDGLFLDPLLVQVDADSAASVGQGYPIRGIVRDLPMLDRGASFSWRSVYGPAPVSFDDETALEVSATFDAEGRYLLELSADDGQTVVKNVAVVVVGSAGDLQPPERPQSLTATADESAIHLDWADNTETDLAGYMIYRATAEEEPTVALEYGLRSSEYTDRSVEKGVRYEYTVWAVDTNSNFSLVSDEADAMVNARPELEFVESLDGQFLNEGWDLELSVEAFDKGGSVAYVELFVNGELVGRRSAEPYAWSYSEADASLLENLELGSYTIEAVATDDEAVSTSKTITFEVIVDETPPSPPKGFTAVANDGWVRLDWSENTEIDWASTQIYRSEELGVPGILLAEQRDSRFVDTNVVNGTRYFYSLTATDTSGLVSARTLPVGVLPEAAPPGMTIFGKLNAGLGGFIPSHGDGDQMWALRIGSVRYRNQNRSNQTAAFLKAFVLDRSVGSSYRLEGVVTLTDGYAHDNNRVGLYLFGDEADVSGRERGALAVPFNLEGGTIAIVDGINGKALSSEGTGRRTDSRFFGTDLKFSVRFTFTETEAGKNMIDVAATLTDSLGQSTTTRATVEAASYTGDWFGFASRTRSRNYGIEGAYENRPWVVDYQYFWLTDD
jgi:fibronectin type 3 domain-containing protein